MLATLFAIAPLAAGNPLLDALARRGETWEVCLPDEGFLEVTARVRADWSLLDSVRLRMRLEPVPKTPVRAVFFMQNRRGWYYQSPHPMPVGVNLASYRVSLGDLDPCGHFRPYEPSCGRDVVRAGVKLFSPLPFEGTVRIESVEGLPLEESRGSAIGALEWRREVSEGQPFEMSFRLEPEPLRPFAEDLDCVVITPSGERVTAPAFYYQDYCERGEELIPVACSMWKVRWRPREDGEHFFKLLRDGGGEALARGRFRAWGTPRGGGSGTGSLTTGFAEYYLWELGRVPGGKGWLPRLAEIPAVFEGKRWVDARSAPGKIGWSVPLEWSDVWGKWEGLGNYDLETAWKLDRVLDAAEERGVSLPFILCDDRPFFNSGKFRWPLNPLNAALGGPLTGPSGFYTEESAQNSFARLARYCCARWSASRAVSSWIVGTGLPSRDVDEWHMKVAACIRSVDGPGKPLYSFHPLAMPFDFIGRAGSFEKGARDWELAREDTPKASFTVTDRRSSSGKRSLRLVPQPGREGSWVSVKKHLDNDLFKYQHLAFEVYLPPEAPENMRAEVVLCDANLFWYSRLIEQPLRPGDWTRLVCDITGEGEWKPGNHECAWTDYSRQRIRELGVRVYCNADYSGPIFLDDVLLLGRKLPEAPLEIARLEQSSDRVGLFSKYELTFDLSRAFENPYDPDVVDIVAFFTTPSSREVAAPAFFYQPCERKLVKRKEHTRGRNWTVEAEEVSPVRRSCWKVRFAPVEPGKHSCRLVVRTGRGKDVALERACPGFVAFPSGRKGFVRVAPDRRYFELSTGEFFYPVGLNIRSPADSRDLGRDPQIAPKVIQAGFRGTYQYDDYFREMEKHGVNWARVWMCSWWCGLEWYRKWPGYSGLGRYNQRNAWRLDHLVEEAERRGVYLQLCTTNHGQLSTRIDHEWEMNPLNYYEPDAYVPQSLRKDTQIQRRPDAGHSRFHRPGGILKEAAQFFTDERAMRHHKNKLRYTVARWGYSTSVMAWVLLSEAEFTEDYWVHAYRHEGRGRAPQTARWHDKMARFVKTIDPWKRPVTTHFSHPHRGNSTWSVKRLEYAQSNAYSTFPWFGGKGMSRAQAHRAGKGESSVGAPLAMERYYYGFMRKWSRPVVVGEWGGHWMGNSVQDLDAELHCGNWASVMTPMAGATGFWWWPHVHFRDRYGAFAAVTAFMKEEDRRGEKLSMGKLHLRGRCKAMGVMSSDWADVWLYDPRLIYDVSRKRSFGPTDATLQGLSGGLYEVEFWDTWDGKPMGVARFFSSGKSLTFTTPPFKGDIAAKVRKVERKRKR